MGGKVEIWHPMILEIAACGAFNGWERICRGKSRWRLCVVQYGLELTSDIKKDGDAGVEENWATP
jgi:hypothetical protein